MAAELVDSVLAQLLGDVDAQADRDRPVRTGFDVLDDALAGGLRTGQTAVIAAPSGEGASTFALGLVREATFNHGLATAVLAPDTPEREIALRLTAAETKVPALSLRRGRLSEREEALVRVHRDRLAAAPVSITAGSKQLWGPEAFVDALDRTTIDSRIRLVVIDDISRLGPSLRGILPMMSALSRSRNFALVLVTDMPPVPAPSGQLSEPECIRDAASFLDLVELVLEVRRCGPGEASVKVAKHRYGPTATIPIGVSDHYGTFFDSAVELVRAP